MTPVDTRQKTLRITEFKGLNKSANPHNIDDAEFTDMVNVELSENRTLQSRMGFTKVISNMNARSVRSLYKVDWDDYTSTLYCSRGMTLTKIDESAATESTIALLIGGSPVQFQRWHDKVLVLAEGYPLNWMNVAEELKPAAYPQFGLKSVGSIDDKDGGELPEGWYQYNISLVLGSNYRDGETAGAFGITPEQWQIDMGWKSRAGDHAFGYVGGSYWNGSEYVPSTVLYAPSSYAPLSYSGKLNGFSISKVRFFRRKLDIKDGVVGDVGPWLLMDEAYINKDEALGTYSLDHATTLVITDITGTYNAADDSAEIAISFTDDGTVDYTAGNEPMPPGYVIIPKARYMARVNNRVFLGNIYGTDPRDKKTVRFTYTGYLDPAATLGEIPNFHYQFPMLLFGPYSWFYCEHEDTDDEITAMRGYRNSLIIFTGKCTFLWQEGMKDPVKISNDVGCVSNQTIREFEGKLIWLSANGVVMYDGNKLKNLSQGKVNSYMLSISKDYAWRATSSIFGRRYYIAAPFTGGVNNEHVLVYDFDLDEWATRNYKILTASSTEANFYVDFFYKYNDGSKEILYAGGHDNQATAMSYVVKIDEGYDDGGVPIECLIKTKYYDFGAPDIIKDIRAFNIDITNFSGSVNIDLYLDNLNTPEYSHTYSGASSGFMLNDDTRGRLNVDSIINVSDEMFAFSLPIGKRSSRFQFGISFSAGFDQTAIHAISFDWSVVRKLQRKHGG